MNTKQALLADIKELAKLYGELPFVRIDRIEQILNSLPETDEYTKQLEQKLNDIECGDCYKNMLECHCDNLPLLANYENEITRRMMDEFLRTSKWVAWDKRTMNNIADWLNSRED